MAAGGRGFQSVEVIIILNILTLAKVYDVDGDDGASDDINDDDEDDDDDDYWPWHALYLGHLVPRDPLSTNQRWRPLNMTMNSYDDEIQVIFVDTAWWWPMLEMMIIVWLTFLFEEVECPDPVSPQSGYIEVFPQQTPKHCND